MDYPQTQGILGIDTTNTTQANLPNRQAAIAGLKHFGVVAWDGTVMEAIMELPRGGVSLFPDSRINVFIVPILCHFQNNRDLTAQEDTHTRFRFGLDIMKAFIGELRARRNGKRAP